MTEIVYGFSKLVVIFLVFRRCGYEIPSLASFPGTICEKVCFNLWFRWSLLTLQGYHNFTVHFLNGSECLLLVFISSLYIHCTNERLLHYSMLYIKYQKIRYFFASKKRQFSFLRHWQEIRKLEICPSEYCPICGGWSELEIPNLAGMSLMNSYWMLQNARVTAFTIPELWREPLG